MATQAQTPEQQRRWVRPLVPIVALLAIVIVFLLIGNAVASLQGEEASAPTRWLPYVLAGGLIAYGLGVAFGEPALWRVGTREVVYMAVGAALYGVLSWATNLIQLPSISLVSLRPAVVVPIFFGLTFGPAVGFFTGFVGNILGDALTGWGVFPTWNLGNGLMGLVPGLIMAFRNRERATDAVLAIVALVAAFAMVLLFLFPDTEILLGSGTAGMFWWIPPLGLALIVVIRYVFRSNRELAAAQVWGALGIVAGIGFAAIADIWWNGYTFTTTFLGQFVPAAGANLINAAILLPFLIAGWSAAQSRAGR
ncbi:MAG: ECF transporter S component [Chloroflexales bacterium]|nr:ECF transporter S component [Chloroflexales bacterium]